MSSVRLSDFYWLTECLNSQRPNMAWTPSFRQLVGQQCQTNPLSARTGCRFRASLRPWQRQALVRAVV